MTIYQYRLAIHDRRTGEVQYTGAQDHEPRGAFTRLADDCTVSLVVLQRREVGPWEYADHAGRAIPALSREQQ